MIAVSFLLWVCPQELASIQIHCLVISERSMHSLFFPCWVSPVLLHIYSLYLQRCYRVLPQGDPDFHDRDQGTVNWHRSKNEAVTHHCADASQPENGEQRHRLVKVGLSHSLGEHLSRRCTTWEWRALRPATESGAVVYSTNLALMLVSLSGKRSKESCRNWCQMWWNDLKPSRSEQCMQWNVVDVVV